MSFPLRIALSRQRLMMLGLLLPLMLACLAVAGFLLWLLPLGFEAWVLAAICLWALKPHRIISHFLLALVPGGPSADEINACLAPVLSDAKARMILNGRSIDNPIQAHLSIDLVDWRWRTRILIRSKLDAHQNLALTQALENALAARFGRLDRARMAVAAFGSEMALPEPVISNHVLLRATRDAS